MAAAAQRTQPMAATAAAAREATMSVRVVRRIRSGIPAAKPEIQTDPGRAYSGPCLVRTSCGRLVEKNPVRKLPPGAAMETGLNEQILYVTQ